MSDPVFVHMRRASDGRWRPCPRTSPGAVLYVRGTAVRRRLCQGCEDALATGRGPMPELCTVCHVDVHLKRVELRSAPPPLSTGARSLLTTAIEGVALPIYLDTK